jgi:hypothetical protein
MHVNEIADTFIRNKLRNDATMQSLISTRVFSGVYPKETDFPGVLFNDQSPRDVLGVGGELIMSTLLYCVRAVDQAEGYGCVDPVADRIHALLHKSSDVDNKVLSCVRVKAFNRAYDVKDVQYRERGGIYQIVIGG